MKDSNQDVVIITIGMVLIPKPEHAFRLRKNLEYVVKQSDIDAGNPMLSDWWMIKQ